MGSDRRAQQGDRTLDRSAGSSGSWAPPSGSEPGRNAAGSANGSAGNGTRGSSDDRRPAFTALDLAAVGSRRIPEATVARLPVYLRCLLDITDGSAATISSERLADMAGVNAAKVRKDLSYLGSYGTRGVGYDVEYLLLHINRVLGLTQDWPVVIAGVGNLGHALANYRGFSARGFRIVALVDDDPAKVGEKVGEVEIRPLGDLQAIAARESIAIGIIATPANSAQAVADCLVSAGVTSILNFAPVLITVPPDVSVRKVDLSIELQILSFYQQRRASEAIGAGA